MPAPPQKLRAVLFDFDGTLADSYPAITASVNHVRATNGLPPLDEPEVRRHVGRGPVYLLQHTVPGADVEKAIASYRAHHPSVMLTGTRVFPGVGAALQALKQAGLRLAVCSNKPRPFTLALLASLGLAELIDVVLGPEDVDRPKPAPDMIQLALARLGVPATEALYVGDMVVDIQSARAAGVAVWVVPTGSDDHDALARGQPDRIVEELSDLPRLLSGPRSRP